MKRIFYSLVACFAILSFWVPVQFIGLTLSAGEYFLFDGTFSILLEYIPLVIESVFRLLQRPQMITDIHEMLWIIQACVFTMAEILHNYAILGLVAWSFLLLTTTSLIWRKLYFMWLVFSLVSSLLMTLNPLFQHGSGFGYWLNPVLLILVSVGEFLMWLKNSSFRTIQLNLL